MKNLNGVNPAPLVNSCREQQGVKKSTKGAGSTSAPFRNKRCGVNPVKFPKSCGIKVIVGLGNPGKKYADTYHNAGHLFIDCITSSPRSSAFSPRKSAIAFLKSGSYMNKSGDFVKKALAKEKAKPAELLVAHDDSDIGLGEYKLSFGRGSAGHKGAENIIKSLGTKNFWRLRIGIRKKSDVKSQALNVRLKAGEFVLKKVSRGDIKLLEGVFEEACSEIMSWERRN